MFFVPVLDGRAGDLRGLDLPDARGGRAAEREGQPGRVPGLRADVKIDYIHRRNVAIMCVSTLTTKFLVM